MSLIPMLIEIADELGNRSQHPFHNELGMLMPQNYYTGYHRRCGPSDNQLIPKIPIVGKDGFQVNLDVKNFAPNEISVKTVDNSIIIEGKHEERKDEHGFISRQFTRRYDLPKNCNVKDVASALSSDGVLTIKAPPLPKPENGDNVRNIQIQQTGPARLNIEKKENSADGKKKSK